LLLGAGKLDGAMALGIGTPPNRETSVLTDLREACRAHPDDKTMVFVEFSANGFEHHPASCDHCLKLANPQLGDLLSADRATALLKQTTEGEYRRKRLCQVVTTNESPFLTADQWDDLISAQPIPDRADVVIALDGSLSDDSTALVMGTVAARPHFDKLGVWEKPKDDDGWRVPVFDVEQAIRDAAKRWKVREIAFDPYLWTRSAQALQAEGLPMVGFRQSPARQTAATNDLHSAAVNGRFTQSGDADLRRHVLAATVLETDNGLRLAKASRSKHAPKIDLCTSLMMAHSRASWLAAQQKPHRRTVSFA
jgi:phage terminase large subunit-like protein